MSFSPEDELSEQTCVPTPKFKLDDEFISCQQEKMSVYLRIRPLLPAEILQDSKMCICVEDSHAVRAIAPFESAKFKNSTHDNNAVDQIFRFTQTFGPEVDQIQFFEETMKTTLDNLIRGQNELVFAYGSTGSGKTYTMQGGLAQPGVIPLTIYLLFGSIKGKQVMSPTFKPHKYSDVIKLSKTDREREEKARERLLSHLDSEDFDDSKSLSGKSSVSISTIFSEDSLDISSQSGLTDKEISALESTGRMKSIACESVSMQGEVLFSIWVSFVEIYNENMYDLLEPVTSNKRARLSLKEDENKNIYVKGLREIRVTSSEEALKLFSLGKRNLRIASTKLNYQSSRSHCIFTIKIIRVLGVDSPLSARVNRLSYCDLAGSERTAKTQNTGLRLREAGNINTSLLVLGRCIDALRQQGSKDKRVVPYRESKLTRLFSAYFTGKGKASMIINVSPASYIFDETLNVLKFSALAKQIISNDLSIKPLAQWNNEISRLTKAYEESSTRWSSFYRNTSQKESGEVISETSMEDENDLDDSFEGAMQRDQLIEELLGHVKSLTNELKKVLIEKENQETEIRAQVCREFAENFVQIDSCYREQVKHLEESSASVITQVHKELKSDVSKDADEEDNAEDSDEDTDDEKEYTSAHEDTPPPVLTKAIEDSGSEILEDKGLPKVDPKSGRSNNGDGKSKSSLRKSKERRQNNTIKDDEMKKYENLVVSKDSEIDKLQKRIENKNENVILLEKKLVELENASKSKDAELKALRIKMQDNELVFDKESVEYEKILSSKGEEVLRITENLKQKDVTIASQGLKVKELENIIDKRSDEIIRLRKKFESEIASKDKELEECLKSMNTRAQEVTELKGRIEEMNKVIIANEEKLQEYIHVVSLKDVEISLLTGPDVGPKANGIKQHENALRCKDDEITELKNRVQAEHLDLLEKEKELEGYKNSIQLKDNELALLKKKLEENGIVAPKEDELKECQSKEAKICELKRIIETLHEDVTSKAKEIEDFKNIVSLKNTEVYLLKDKIEENEVIISKGKELSEAEEIVKSKDESIARLKKAVEDHRKTLFLKDKELEECKNNLNSKVKELSALREKIEDTEVIVPKVDELKEYKKSLNSKEAEIMKLKKRIGDLEESATSRNELIQELETTIQKGGDILITKDSEIHELQRQVADLRNRNKKSRDGRMKDDNNIVKSQGMEITNLNGKIEKLNKMIATKDSKIKEDNNIIKSQEVEIANLKGKIGKLDKTISSKDDLVKELEKKIKKNEEILSSKNIEVYKLQKKISDFESTKSEDGRVKVREKESKKTEEMLYPNDKKIIELQQMIAAAGNKASESKAPEWQNVQYLTELVQESSKTFASQNAKLVAMEKRYNDLLEKFEEGKKLIQQEFNKKFEEQEESLTKKTTEIEELQSKLKEKETAQQELSKKFEEQEQSLSKKSNEVKELEGKLEHQLAEEAKSKEKHMLIENQIKVLGDLVVVLQQSEFQAHNRVPDLEKQLEYFKDELNNKIAEVQELETKAKEEKMERQKAEERWKAEEDRRKVAEEEWQKAEEEKQKAVELKQKAEEEKEKAEKEKEKAEKEKERAEEEKEKAEEEKQKAEVEKCKAEEERQKVVEEAKRISAEEERQRAEEEKERMRAEEKKKMSRIEREMQTENTEKHEREAQTENCESEKVVVDIAKDEVGHPEYQKKLKNSKRQKEKEIEPHEIYSSEETEKKDICDAVRVSGTQEESIGLYDGDTTEEYEDTTDTKLQTQVSYDKRLVSCLQRIEMIAAENIIRLNKENRNYCNKLLDLSEDLEVKRIKLATIEQETASKENKCRPLKTEQNSKTEVKIESTVDSQGSLHLIDLLQNIEYVSAQNTNKLSQENSRLVLENNSLLEQMQTSTIELELATEEIERKDLEHCKAQGYLRKKDARILCLEYELTEAQKKLKNMETKNRMQLLEEQTQHGIEVEQVIALKRQAETDYRSLERKLTAVTESTEESTMQRTTQTESTEELRQRKKQTRRGRYKGNGKKRTSADEDGDYEPSQKKRMVKNKVYCEDDISPCSVDEDFKPSQKKRGVKNKVYYEEDTSPCSVGIEKLPCTEEASSSLQRFQEFVAEKSPAIKAVAQRVATFLSPKSGCSKDSSSTVSLTLKKKKRKLFNNTLATPFITSPVQETVTKISPKKVVNRKLRNKKDSK